MHFKNMQVLYLKMFSTGFILLKRSALGDAFTENPMQSRVQY